MSTHDDIVRVTASLRTKSNQLFRGLVIEAAGRIVRRTPVDTGRARGNWNVSTGEPDLSVDMAKAGSAEGMAQEAVGRAQAAVAQLELGDTAYIVNGLPYIEALEHG